MKQSFFKWMAACLCGLLLVHPLGCTRLRTDGIAPSALPHSPLALNTSPALEVAGVTFSAFRNASDARQRETFDGEVLTQLWLFREGRRELVHRDYSPTWSRTDLIPGEYELEVVEIYTAQRSFPPNDENVVSFTLLPDSTLQVNLLSRQVPWGAVAVVTVAAVLVVGLIVYAIVAEDAPEIGPMRLPGNIAARHVSLHAPPVRLPPLRWHGALNVEVNPSFPLDLFFDGLGQLEPYFPYSPAQAMPPEAPFLTVIRPPACTEQESALSLSFSEDMNPFYMGPDTIRLFREDGQAIAGGVVYDVAKRRATFYPLHPLEPAAYKLVVLGTLMMDSANRPMKENTTFVFSHCER